MSAIGSSVAYSSESIRGLSRVLNMRLVLRFSEFFLLSLKRSKPATIQGYERFALYICAKVKSMIRSRVMASFGFLERNARISLQDKALNAAEHLACINSDFLNRIDFLVGLDHVRKITAIHEIRMKLMALRVLRSVN